MARPNQSKNKILEAAADCFARKGFDSTSTDEIALAAGVAKGSVYYNFKSKEELFCAVIEWGLEIIDHESEKILEEDISEDRILMKLIILYADLVLDYPELASVIFTFRTERLSPAWRDRMRELTDSSIERVAALLREGAEAGFLKEMDYPMAASGMFGMIWNSCDFYMRKRPGESREELYAVLYDTFVSGIVKGGHREG